MKIEVEFDVPDVRLTVLSTMVSCGSSTVFVKALSTGIDVECVVQTGGGRGLSDKPRPYGEALAIAGRCVQAQETERLAEETVRRIIADRNESNGVAT